MPPILAAAVSYIAPILAKAALSLVISLLKKSGVAGKAAAVGIETVQHAQNAIDGIKTYQQYPTGKNGV